jgi:hypothetical protein
VEIDFHVRRNNRAAQSYGDGTIPRKPWEFPRIRGWFSISCFRSGNRRQGDRAWCWHLWERVKLYGLCAWHTNHEWNAAPLMAQPGLRPGLGNPLSKASLGQAWRDGKFPGQFIFDVVLNPHSITSLYPRARPWVGWRTELFFSRNVIAIPAAVPIRPPMTALLTMAASNS